MDTLVLLIYTCGMAAMWLADRDGGYENFYSVMLFFFGPFSLLYVLATRKDTESPKRGAVGVLGLILSGVYGLMVLQWMTGKGVPW
jgi:hypothetical protein